MQGLPFTPLSPAPKQLILAHSSSKWKTIRSMLGLVIVIFMIVQITALVFIGIFDADGDGYLGPTDSLLTLVSSICLLPFIILFGYLRKPRLAHVIRGSESLYGSQVNLISPRTVIQSTTPLVIQHHLVHDSAPLEMPQGRHLWLLFFSGVMISSLFMLPLLITGFTTLSVLLFILIAIPALLVGFSTPVFAWWSTSHRYFGLPTTRRMAEWMLIAGMFSTLPAIIINSLLAPISLQFIGFEALEPSSLGFGLTLFVFAPIGEEICKALAVLTLARFIDSPKRGFQVGFTVGLGFALLENLGYILNSFASVDTVAVEFAMTSVLRGISSIPGHGVWTGITGYAIGCYLTTKANPVAVGFDTDESLQSVQPNWMLLNKHGEIVEQSSQSVLRQTEVPRWLCAPIEKAWSLPSLPAKGLMLAILGHAFWNGSLWGMSLLSSSLPVPITIALQLGWMVVLIAGLWYITRRIIPTALGNSNRF